MGTTRVCGSCTTSEVCIVNGILSHIDAKGSIRCRHYRDNEEMQPAAARTRSPEDINQVSSELKRLYEETEKEKSRRTASSDNTVCDICGKSFSKEESEICASCGRIICPDCTVISADQNKALCEDCFS